MGGGDDRPSEQTKNRVEGLHLSAAAGERGVGKGQVFFSFYTGELGHPYLAIGH
jgi:hypothetical protein